MCTSRISGRDQHVGGLNLGLQTNSTHVGGFIYWITTLESIVKKCVVVFELAEEVVAM